MTKPKLIILDRDGVINFDSEAYIKSPDEWIPIAGSVEAIAALSKQFIIHIATNQSGLARKYFTPEILNAIHKKMKDAVEALGGLISFIAYCPHGPDEGCDCRKPKPGLIEQCLQEANVAAHEAIVIGDSARDLEAAKAAGSPAWLVLTGNGLETQAKYIQKGLSRPETFENLSAAAKRLLML